MTGNCGDVQGSPKDRRPSRRVTFPRDCWSSPSRSTSITDIKARLHEGHYESLCRDWLSHGSKQGRWWVATAPWREDSNPSLGFSLTSGKWFDFATGDRGDIIDLSMRLHGISLAEAIKDFEEMLGISNG